MPAVEGADIANFIGTVAVSPVTPPPAPGTIVLPTDLTTTWSLGIPKGDWTITGGLLQTGQDLATAIILSIFTDAEAQGGDNIPDGTTDRRGWYSDDQDPVRMGSRLHGSSPARRCCRRSSRAGAATSPTACNG